MAEMLLINPAPRKKKKARSAAQKRNDARLGRMARARARGRSGTRTASRAASSTTRRRKMRARVQTSPGVSLQVNPARRRRRVARRANPVSVLRRRRRRNPIGLGGIGNVFSYINLIKDGAIGGAGAVAVDLAMGYITPQLPASMRRVPGQVGLGDAVKAVLTVALGKLLSRPTKGLSLTAAKGSLVVQAHGLFAQMLPSTMQLGYAVPARVVPMSNRIGPNRTELARYTRPNVTPLLSRYTRPGGMTPLLSGRESAMARESVIR